MTLAMQVDNKENKEIEVNPLLLFQRMLAFVKDPYDQKDCFQYEISPFPLPIFDQNGIRKNTNFFKHWIIKLCHTLQHNKIGTKQSLDDAYALIVNTAIEESEKLQTQ